MRLFKALAISVTALLAIGASKPFPNWNATVTVTEAGSHILGNPDADVKVVEYVSYTCPHCSTFQKQSEAPMRLAYISPGNVSVEVRHLLRDPVDLTVAMLVNCGEPEGFFRRHNVFLYNQERWLTRMGNMGHSQKKRWQTGPIPKRMQAVASDFGFYDTMARWGYNRIYVNRCLSDEAKAERLAEQSAEAGRAGVTSTPSFAINEIPLIATHDWKTLSLQIQARFLPNQESRDP